MNLQLAPLQPDDDRAIETCASLMSSSEPWKTLGRSYAESVKILTDTTNETCVFYLEGRIVGFAVLVMHGALVGFIRNIAIAPEWRNKGLGRQAVMLIERRIFHKYPNVFLCVSSYNKDAQRFYRRLGYEKIGEIPDYVMEGHSEWILRKTVGPKTEYYRNKGDE